MDSPKTVCAPLAGANTAKQRAVDTVTPNQGEFANPAKVFAPKGRKPATDVRQSTENGAEDGGRGGAGTGVRRFPKKVFRVNSGNGNLVVSMIPTHCA